MERNKTVEEFINKYPEWNKELNKLRKILLKTEMEEGVKWGMPAYMVNKKNVIGIGAFKSYVGLWFHQGVFLKDEEKMLFNAQEGKTKGMRQWRFSNLKEINEKLILKYANEAIQNQKEGKEIKIVRKKIEAVNVPEELKKALVKNKKLNAQFEGMSMYKRKEYAEYISTAKREATKMKRLEKILPMIKEGKGLNDQYK